MPYRKYNAKLKSDLIFIVSSRLVWRSVLVMSGDFHIYAIKMVVVLS